MLHRLVYILVANSNSLVAFLRLRDPCRQISSNFGNLGNEGKTYSFWKHIFILRLMPNDSILGLPFLPLLPEFVVDGFEVYRSIYRIVTKSYRSFQVVYNFASDFLGGHCRISFVNKDPTMSLLFFTGASPYFPILFFCLLYQLNQPNWLFDYGCIFYRNVHVQSKFFSYYLFIELIPAS